MMQPDKANGRQARIPIRGPVVMSVVLLVLFWGTAALSVPVPADAATLKEVRMGNHGEYIRVVFEFSDAVQYDLSENSAAGMATIRFLDTSSGLSDKSIKGAPGCIDTVTAFQEGNHLVANIVFDPKKVQLNPFTLRKPDRVVLDIFCGKTPATAETLPEPGNAAPEPEPDNVSSEIIAGEADIQAGKSEPPPITPTVQPSILQTRTTAALPVTKDNSQRYLLLLLAVITSVIVLIIALIIFQKRSLLERHAIENPDTIKNQDDMMADIDTRIKEKLMKYDG